jgi:hypothetical protein
MHSCARTGPSVQHANFLRHVSRHSVSKGVWQSNAVSVYVFCYDALTYVVSAVTEALCTNARTDPEQTER